MADSQSRFAALPPRQKATIVVFVLLAFFVVWEVIGMFRGNSSNSVISPAIAETKPSAPPMTAAPPKPGMVTKSAPLASPPPSPSEPPKKIMPAALSSAPPPKVVAPKTPEQSRPVVEKTLPQSEFLIQQEQIQGKYVAALNDLQMLKIQKEIAETSQAIIAAKLATVTAEKTINDLLSEAQSSSDMGSSRNKKGEPPSSTSLAPTPPPPPEVSVGYSVQSVSMEQDQWHAVVKFKDKLYDVGVGDVLPPDKSTVKAIDQRGITLDTSGFEQKIPLTVTDNDVSTSGGTSSGGTAASPGEAPAAPSPPS